MDLLEVDRDNPNRHPWELARAASVLSLVRALPRSTQYADIGAGDMYVSRQLAERSRLPVIAVDPGYETTVAPRGIEAHSDLSQVPAAAADCAFLMDVLEHVDDDHRLLQGVARVVRNGGRIIITVPAHRALWTDHDVFLGHRRRYSRAELLRLTASCGLVVDECFYFFGLALAQRVVDRTLSGGSTGEPPKGVGGWRFAMTHPFTRLVSFLLKSDFVANRTLNKLFLPTMGLSICAVCRTRG